MRHLTVARDDRQRDAARQLTGACYTRTTADCSVRHVDSQSLDKKPTDAYSRCAYETRRMHVYPR